MSAQAVPEGPACAGMSTDLFFRPDRPGKGGRVGRADVWSPAPALAVCARCPVVMACRREAEKRGDIVDGIAVWGVIGGVPPAGAGHRRASCGTPQGYRVHLRQGETACVECLVAQATSVRRYYRRPPCGTMAGYKSHRRRGETPCGECRAARAAYDADRRPPQVLAPTIRPECGTTRGHDRHRAAGERTCEACKDAYNAREADRKRAARGVAEKES